MSIFKQSLAVAGKELASEFRTRYSVSAVLLFILTTVAMVVFSSSSEKLSSNMSAGILWIIMFFGSMTGLAKSFVSEEERGTSLLLKVNSSSASVYFGKLIFNVLLSIGLNYFAVILLFIFMDNITVELFGEFILVIFLGSIGMAAATTIISALIAKANSKSALFPILSFPILLPLIIIGIESTQYTFDTSLNLEIIKNYMMMLSYCGILTVASFFLFDIVWSD
jgi:heme exporter protein B